MLNPQILLMYQCSPPESSRNDTSAHQEGKNNQSSIHNPPMNNLSQNPFHHFPLKNHEFKVVLTQSCDISSSSVEE